MGEKWVGTQAGTPSTIGWEQLNLVEEWSSANSLVSAVALLTNSDGLARWLGTPIQFDSRRGANLKFSDAEGEFGGSYSLIEIPSRFVINTERYGEISASLSDAKPGCNWKVVVTRLIQPGEDEQAMERTILEMIERLKGVSRAVA